ncbi:flagellin, partial [Anaerobiospirillum succiniciproducens]|uniref:flagellin n=1 Tax=Anaerobiospirillum succiniciproducens TaxID=13335 RepID=UPI002943DE06
LNQGNRNAADGIALAQTVEAGMDEISGMLQKIRTLAVQASNGTNTKEDRQALSKEASSLANEISRIADQTTFAGKKILKGFQGADGIYEGTKQGAANGSTGRLTLQVGSNKGDTISFDVKSFMFSAITKDAGHDGKMDAAAPTQGKPIGIQGGVITIALTEVSDTQNLIQVMDDMISKVDGARADLGAIQNRLESSIRNQSNVAANEADARSRIRDADFAEESANLSQQSIIQQAAASMLMQANTRPQLGLSLLG